MNVNLQQVMACLNIKNEVSIEDLLQDRDSEFEKVIQNLDIYKSVLFHLFIYYREEYSLETSTFTQPIFNYLFGEHPKNHKQSHTRFKKNFLKKPVQS